MAKGSRMIDVGGKDETVRVATARGCLRMAPRTLAAIKAQKIEKGDVFRLAEVAAIMAAKETPRIVPLCHPLSLSGVEVRFEDEENEATLTVEVCVKSFGRTGVEMEALCAAAAACLCIYDMCKSIDRGMTIKDIGLWRKEGGRSGVWERQE